MVKALFKPGEVAISNDKVTLSDPLSYGDANLLNDEIIDAVATDEKNAEEAQAPEVEVYQGPTVEELQKQADEFKQNFEKEKEQMLAEAHAQADQLLADAQSKAMAARQSEEEKAAEVKQQAEAAAKQLVDDATAKAAALAKDAKDAVKKDRDSAREEGKKEGREEAWKSGQDEAVRLVERLRTVLEKTQAIRADVLSSTESQLVQLALIISRKVIKSLASSQEGIVVDTVKAALAKVKGRGKIVIRVNTADMNLTTAHTKDFVNMLEGIENVEVQEDSTIGVGGCVVETSFGEIDARIESQLNELEDRITTLSPIKGKA